MFTRRKSYQASVHYLSNEPEFSEFNDFPISNLRLEKSRREVKLWGRNFTITVKDDEAYIAKWRKSFKRTKVVFSREIMKSQ